MDRFAKDLEPRFSPDRDLAVVRPEECRRLGENPEVAILEANNSANKLPPRIQKQVPGIVIEFRFDAEVGAPAAT
jgi:hypothetical protein